MKTKIELDQNIINITTKIQTEFPELVKYITEMPENNSEEAAVNLKNLADYCDSLHNILAEYSKTHPSAKSNTKDINPAYADLQLYPESQDIYNQFKQETEINPEDISKKKVQNEKEGTPNEKDFEQDKSGSDLDVPGSELDDEQEQTGNEDEENNYYSLGGDDHNDLEEDKI